MYLLSYLFELARVVFEVCSLLVEIRFCFPDIYYVLQRRFKRKRWPPIAWPYCPSLFGFLELTLAFVNKARVGSLDAPGCTHDEATGMRGAPE